MEKGVKEKIEVKITNTENAIGWLERFLKLVKEYGSKRIFTSTLFIIFVSAIFYFGLNPTKGFEIYDAWKERQHDEKMELRMQVGPKIQAITDKLTFKVDATRVLVLELHNGNTGGGGLPFTKCSATYESVNINKIPIASQYQEVNMSLMPFANHLFQQGYWCGDIDTLEKIDRSLAYRMKSNHTEHFAACVIEGVEDKAIAFMIVSFDSPAESMNRHNCEETRNYIRHTAMEIAVYLEVNRLTTEIKE
jgi:hypothetical protein